MAKKLGNMTKVQQQREKKRKVLEPLEVIEDSTMLKGVMLDKAVTHWERKKRIIQTAQVTPKLSCCEEETREEGDLGKILEQEEGYTQKNCDESQSKYLDMLQRAGNQPKEVVKERENKEEKDETKKSCNEAQSKYPDMLQKAGNQPKEVVREMEDEELAENHAPIAQIGGVDGNTLYTTLDPRQEVSTGNQPKEVFKESKTEESLGKEKKVREPLEVIEGSTKLKGVVFGKDVTHPERNRGIVQSIRTSTK